MTDEELMTGPWNVRYRAMVVMMDTSEGRTRVVSILTRLRETKDLSFGERTLFDIASNWEAYKRAEAEKIVELSVHRKRATA